MPKTWLAITKIHALANWWYVVAIAYAPYGAFNAARRLLRNDHYCKLAMRVVDGNDPALPYEIRYYQPAIDLRAT